MKLRLKNVMAYMPFAYYYIGPIAFITYLMAARSLLGRFSKGGLFFCLSFTLYVFWVLSENGIVNGLYVVRFFWGFLFFYLIFRSGVQIQIEKTLIFLSILTLLEAILVNTVISAQLLPNYPSVTGAEGHYAGADNYQRPYSFGGSASVTSVVLVSLLTLSELGWRGKSLAVAATMACMSGSGFVAFFIYSFAKVPAIIRFLLIPITLGVVYSELIDRLSANYISYLFELKMDQFMDQMPLDSVNSFLLGIPYESSMGGDFAGLSFLVHNGFVGLILLLTIIFLKINKKNWLPILIMFVATIHYGAIFFLPGQLMFGYLLNLKPEKIPVHVPNQKDCA